METIRDEIRLLLSGSGELWDDICELGKAAGVPRDGSDEDYAVSVLLAAAPVAVVELDGCRCLLDLRSMQVANDNILMEVAA